MNQQPHRAPQHEKYVPGTAWKPTSVSRFNLKLFLQPALHMLLLPLFLWWAHSPLSVATGRIRSVLCVTVALALLLVTFAPQTNCEAEDRLRQRMPANEGLFGDPLNRDKRNANEEKVVLLREGTLIPPTKGRIVMLGRRWTFISDWADKQRRGEDSAALAPMRHIDMFEASIASLQRARAVVGYSRERKRTQEEQKQLPTRLASTKVEHTNEADQNEIAKLSQVLLSENLMLQRIVESIRVDASDDRWSVTGEVSEFMGENRLLIHTAQRASKR